MGHEDIDAAVLRKKLQQLATEKYNKIKKESFQVAIKPEKIYTIPMIVGSDIFKAFGKDQSKKLQESLVPLGISRVGVEAGGGGAFVLKAPGGLAVRVSRTPPTKDIDLPQFLEPLESFSIAGQKEGETWHVEILPRVVPLPEVALPLEKIKRDELTREDRAKRLSREEVRFIKNHLNASLLPQHFSSDLMDDTSENNIGLLPDGTPIIIDRDAIEKLGALNEESQDAGIENKGEIQTFIDHHIRPLRKGVPPFSWLTEGEEWKQTACFAAVREGLESQQASAPAARGR